MRSYVEMKVIARSIKEQLHETKSELIQYLQLINDDRTEISMKLFDIAFAVKSEGPVLFYTNYTSRGNFTEQIPVNGGDGFIPTLPKKIENRLFEYSHNYLDANSPEWVSVPTAKRYQLYIPYDFYAAGGPEDFDTSFDDLDDVFEYLKQVSSGHYGGRVQIYDATNGTYKVVDGEDLKGKTNPPVVLAASISPTDRMVAINNGKSFQGPRTGFVMIGDECVDAERVGTHSLVIRTRGCLDTKKKRHPTGTTIVSHKGVV